MNIVQFTKHVASRKRVPVLMETKTLQVEMPPPCQDTTPKMTPNKCKGNATLPTGTVESINLSGKRQWIRLRVASAWVDQQLETLGVERSDTLYLSRYRTDFNGKLKVPLRVWTPDMELLDHRLQAGDVVQCAVHELRAYEGRESRQCCGELYRDIVLVKKNNKRRRVKGYFSDGED